MIARRLTFDFTGVVTPPHTPVCTSLGYGVRLQEVWKEVVLCLELSRESNMGRCDVCQCPIQCRFLYPFEV